MNIGIGVGVGFQQGVGSFVQIPETPPETTLIQSGLVNEYRFDEGSGQQVTDFIGGYHAVLGETSSTEASDPVWVTEGLSFSTNDYVLSTNAPNVTAPSTTTFIVNGSDGSASSSLSASNETQSKYAFKFEQYNNTGKLGFTNRDLGGPDKVFTNATSPFGAWTEISFVVSLTDTKVYKNGVLVDTLAFIVPSSIYYIGAAKNTSVTDFFNGKMAYLLRYNRALTNTEISENYNALKGKLVTRSIALP